MAVDTQALPEAEKRATGPQNAMAEDPRYHRILGAVARGWCYSPNAHKTIDSDLAICIAMEVYKMGSVVR